MSKKKTKVPSALEAGKVMTISAKTRQEATLQVSALRKQAAEAGLSHQGGFIEYRDGLFFATIAFVEQ